MVENVLRLRELIVQEDELKKKRGRGTPRLEYFPHITKDMEWEVKVLVWDRFGSGWLCHTSLRIIHYVL